MEREIWNYKWNVNTMDPFQKVGRLSSLYLRVKILLKYKESVPDRTKITAEFGTTTGVHILYIPA